ncbi:MAG TPA: hypothetical protein EYP22_05825, partial [Methanosarcinales archaeon]|nr:hypothetical protein [Methanosarcinales archaeon]
ADVSENEGGADDDQPDNGVTNSIAATVDAGEEDTANDFVEEDIKGSWSGNVSEDTNNDDIGDTPISGVLITLYLDDNANGILDSGETTIVGSTTTDSSGDYIITGLTPDYYIAVETQPTGFDDVNEDEGGLDNDGNGNPANNNQIAGIVDAGEIDQNNDFVEEEQSVQLGSWSGNVSEDTNNDDIGDTPMSGVTITLYTDPNSDGNPSDGSVAGISTTDSNGNYIFTGLTPGSYVVVEAQPDGYDDVSENEGGSDNDQGNNGINNSIAGIVDAGETDQHNDFVEEAQTGSWNGNVSEDTNGDGEGDTPIPGVLITLHPDYNGNGLLDPDEEAVIAGTGTTDHNGNYSINNLIPGSYLAVETQPDGYGNVSEVDGGADHDSSDNGVINVIPGTVSPGENDTNNNFVEYNMNRATPTPTPTPISRPDRPNRPPPHPTNAEVSEITATSAVLTWDDNSNGEIGFRIYKGSLLVARVGANITTYMLKGLDPKTTYTYRIKSHNRFGESYWSTVSFTTEDDYAWMPAVYHIIPLD